jgi:hypothetical protein
MSDICVTRASSPGTAQGVEHQDLPLHHVGGVRNPVLHTPAKQAARSACLKAFKFACDPVFRVGDLSCNFVPESIDVIPGRVGIRPGSLALFGPEIRERPHELVVPIG